LILTLNGSVYGRNRIEVMDVLQAVVNTSLVTTFQITTFNRSASNKANIFRKDIPGNWIYLGGTKKTLSCNLIF